MSLFFMDKTHTYSTTVDDKGSTKSNQDITFILFFMLTIILPRIEWNRVEVGEGYTYKF